MRRTYKYKASLSRRTAVAATRQLGLCCELYNAALQERRDAYRLAGVSISQAMQSRQLPEIKELRPDVLELIELGEQMNIQVRDMAAMLSEPRLDLVRVRELANIVDAGESKADDIVAKAERQLVTEYSPAGANRLEFLAWEKLYNLLEQVTDDANHCAKLILSLARKES